MTLAEICRKVKSYPGLTRKEPIRQVYEQLVLSGVGGPQMETYGDDAAVIPFKDGFLLLAADGIMTRLLINEPYAAGKASVMVTVNDIYSMGGKPLALVNVLASGDDEQRRQIVAGIRKGCEKLKVSMAGGHLQPDASPESPHLSVAILGWAEKVIHGYTARPGDDLVVAADLTGKAGCRSVVSWDANSHKTSAELLHRLEILPILAAPPEHTGKVLDLFHQRKIAAAKVGRVTPDKQIIVKKSNEEQPLFDFNAEQITGIVNPG